MDIPAAQLALTGTGTVLHLLDPDSAPGDARTLCGRPNACTAMGYGTPDEPRTPLCAHCAALRGGTAFRCPLCGKLSHHPKDRDEGYCGHCHAFTGTRPGHTVTAEEVVAANAVHAATGGVLLHLYVSTACQHELHRARCRLVCKYCLAPCLCPCHRPPD